MTTNEILYTGYAYPFQVRGGQLVTVSNAELVKCHIQHVIETEPLENPLRPEYGIEHNLFSTNSYQQQQDYLNRVTTQLVTYVPEATFSVILQNEDEGLFLHVYWSYGGEEQETLLFAL